MFNKGEKVMENNIYSQENLQRLMQDCLTEIKNGLKNSQHTEYFSTHF